MVECKLGKISNIQRLFEHYSSCNLNAEREKAQILKLNNNNSIIVIISKYPTWCKRALNSFSLKYDDYKISDNHLMRLSA